MRYMAVGEVPAKRHSQVWRDNGARHLLTEEVMGYEGFSGNESILYHLGSPCRIAEIGPLTPIARGGDPVSGRQVLMFNGDIEVSVCKPTSELEGFYRNGEGDEVLYIHRGSGVLRTVFGRVPFRERDYVLIPRGTTVAWDLDEGVEQFWICFHTPGEMETPNRYRNRYGQLLEHAPYSQRDFHGPTELETFDESGS